MKRYQSPLCFLMAICLVPVLLFSAPVAQGASEQPDILLKINRIEHTLSLIDSMVSSGAGQTMQTPTAYIRAMLQGTDWIDPNRPIVIGVVFKQLQPGATPGAAAFVPFVTPNDNFKIAYNAVSGNDYYIVPLPPGKPGPLAPEMELGLVAASRLKPAGIISVEVAASQLIKKADQQIRKMLLDIEQKMPRKQPGTDLTPQDAKKLVENLIHTGAQMRTIGMGLDVTDKEVVVSTGVKANKGTDLYRLFDRSPESYSSFLTGYLPRYPITFRSNSYDIKGMLDFFNLMFGEFYKKIGMNLADIEPMAVNFTGEAAGGMAIGPKGIDFEMIVVRNKTDIPGEQFLETEYLPWVLDYGRKLTDMVNKANPGTRVKNLFTKTATSKIEGRKVFGMKGSIPLFSPLSGAGDRFAFDMRMTAVDNFILTASGDERLGHLVQVAKTLEKRPTAGPLMQAEIDLGSFVHSIREAAATAGVNIGASFPELGSLFYTLDMKSGSLDTAYRIRIDDIKALASYFKGLAAGPRVARRGGQPITGPSVFRKARQVGGAYTWQQPPPPKKDTPRYWLNKGLLFATYGNDREAIKHFKKAIDLDPENSSAYFNLGLSYSELGEHQKAISAIQKAVSLDPENGAYYYGLGWAYQLSGNQASALKNIEKAADLDSMDAQRYLGRNLRKAR